jgi:hypothetical protein
MGAALVQTALVQALLLGLIIALAGPATTSDDQLNEGRPQCPASPPVPPVPLVGSYGVAEPLRPSPRASCAALPAERGYIGTGVGRAALTPDNGYLATLWRLDRRPQPVRLTVSA